MTFHLRSDGKWTNGDPVTAEDFEYSWKRTISPELAADYAYQFYGIVGAADYNACQKNCDALADKVGVKALDDTTLEVKLTTPQPWFVQQVSHTSFLAVHRATVEQFGDRWTDPKNIVTDGPFTVRTADFPGLNATNVLVDVSSQVPGRAIIRTGASAYAAFSMICTHQQCLTDVRNNRFECPCHGSRFANDGSVINGPAELPLQRLAVTVNGNGTLTVG